MAQEWRVKLDRKGIGALLKTGGIPNTINRTARGIAASITLPSDSPDDAEVVVEPYVTDRGAAAVVVKHPKALGLEAKYGLLSRAAASAGFTVRRK